MDVMIFAFSVGQNERSTRTDSEEAVDNKQWVEQNEIK